MTVSVRGTEFYLLPAQRIGCQGSVQFGLQPLDCRPNLMGYKKLKLANAWIDPTYCKEFLASRIYRKYLPTPEINLMKLNTQGQYVILREYRERRAILPKALWGGRRVLSATVRVFCDENGEATEGAFPIAISAQHRSLSGQLHVEIRRGKPWWTSLNLESEPAESGVS